MVLDTFINGAKAVGNFVLDVGANLLSPITVPLSGLFGNDILGARSTLIGGLTLDPIKIDIPKFDPVVKTKSNGNDAQDGIDAAANAGNGSEKKDPLDVLLKDFDFRNVSEEEAANLLPVQNPESNDRADSINGKSASSFASQEQKDNSTEIAAEKARLKEQARLRIVETAIQEFNNRQDGLLSKQDFIDVALGRDDLFNNSDALLADKRTIEQVQAELNAELDLAIVNRNLEIFLGNTVFSKDNDKPLDPRVADLILGVPLEGPLVPIENQKSLGKEFLFEVDNTFLNAPSTAIDFAKRKGSLAKDAVIQQGKQVIQVIDTAKDRLLGSS